MRRIIIVAGARPNFVKIAPLMRELTPANGFEAILVNTGQHYSPSMADRFFEDLSIPQANFSLNVGAGTHAIQTAEIMRRLEPVLDQTSPDIVLVVGDVNSTVAAALVAKKKNLLLAHVEAGLRSFDRSMPEEINRLVTDSISDILFATEPAAVSNLMAEGVLETKIHLVGNVMIDSLVYCRELFKTSTIRDQLGLLSAKYVVATLHRPSNVDSDVQLANCIELLNTIANDYPVVFPVHPRTMKRMSNLTDVWIHPHVHTLEPLGYVDFLGLVSQSAAVLTDSGGLQEETTYLGIPCFTMRENTERPVTITHGTNRLVGINPQSVLAAWHDRFNSNRSAETVAIPGWDGKAASRIRQALTEFLG